LFSLPEPIGHIYGGNIRQFDYLLKVPICIFDAKTGVLCPKCESRLKKGELTKIDVECSVKLMKLSNKNQDIDNLNLIGSQKIDDDYVLILKDSNIGHINSNAKMLSSVEKEFNGKVWFIEANSSIRRFIENLFFPIRILRTNMVWLPDGNQVTQVTIDSKDYEKSFSMIEKIKKIVQVLRNIELVVDIHKK
jgi:transcription antitermination factor NusA-like protein